MFAIQSKNFQVWGLLCKGENLTWHLGMVGIEIVEKVPLSFWGKNKAVGITNCKMKWEAGVLEGFSASLTKESCET